MPKPGSEWQTFDQDQMLDKVITAPQRAQQHWQLGLQHPVQTHQEIRQIVVCGMGGSGSTGDFLQALCKSAQVPIWVNKSAELPNWVNAQTLVIGVSYSGQTAETLACIEQALTQGAQLHLLSSGGRVAELAERHAITRVPVDGGLPPRAALFDLAFALLGSIIDCSLFQVDRKDCEAALQWLNTLSQTWEPNDRVKPLPLSLAEHLLPFANLLLWGRAGESGELALRWKNQLAENSKRLASVGVFPELNHNEIVPICARHHSQSAAIYLSLESTLSAFDQTSLELIEPHLGRIEVVRAQGVGRLQRLLYLIYLGDFLSVYLAFLSETDPTPIAAISELKNRMAEIKE